LLWGLVVAIVGVVGGDVDLRSADVTVQAALVRRS